MNPIRMIGIPLLFSGITIAPTVIIGTLKAQAQLLIGFYNRASDS